MTDRTVSGWTAGQALDAIRAWADEHGEPPRAVDWSPSLARSRGRNDVADRWERERPRWPRANVIERLFGGWSAGLVAASYPATARGVQRGNSHHTTSGTPGRVTGAWTRELITQAIRRWHREHGAWPTVTDWQRSPPGTEHPTEGVVRATFGGWDAAIRAAGGTPARRPMPRPAGSTDLDDRIVQLRARGLTIQQIADRVGRDRSTVSVRLSRLRRAQGAEERQS